MLLSIGLLHKLFFDGSLEDYVTKTAQAYADQVSGMMKTLTDTMLAAVGALIGTFVAALFKDAFNPFIFRVGMLAYAGYVVAFPLIYVMSATIGRFSDLSKEVNTRKDRFADRLTLDRVQVIVGTLISAQQQRFILWFWITAILYVILVVLFVAGALMVPDALAHATLVPLQPTPTATPRA